MRSGDFPRPFPGIEFERDSDFEEYEKRTPASGWFRDLDSSRKRFKQLLDRKTPEVSVQKFLERHPYLLPGLTQLHHGPLLGIIATKFPLGIDYQSDFAFASSNSQSCIFTCIEIESPRKALFRKDGGFNRDYLDAKQQLVDWLFWCQHNIKSALECWGPLKRCFNPNYYEIKFCGYLVFGRRTEINTPKRQARWSGEAACSHPALVTMTYDRLLEYAQWVDPYFRYNKLAVGNFRDKRFFVKHVCG